MNAIVRHITTKYAADTATVIIGGFDLASTIVLRFTELACQYPARFILRPKGVFAVAICVDLSSLYHTSERQIKKNYFPPAVADARYILGVLQQACGTLEGHLESYRSLSPFLHTETGPGNEQYLDKVAVRLYYDTDISWQLNTRRNSLYDTDVPDATELVDRPLLAGNSRAAFIPAKVPGVRSNGQRNASALSIVDETDCIQWIKGLLNILDYTNPKAWIAPYTWMVPAGWRTEQSYVPGPSSPHFPLKAIEDLRLPPGWGDTGSDEYWSAAILFWLNGSQKIDTGIVKASLTTYCDELIAGSIIRRHLAIPPGTIKPTQVTVKKISAEPDDRETYPGRIAMFDFLGQKQIMLNYLVHVKSCFERGHTPEGEYLSRKDVLSSIRKNLGLTTGPQPIIDKKAAGIGELMLDVPASYEEELTQEKLFAWHQMLMKGSKGLEVGAWRTHEEPMQVVSGAMGRQTVHYEAPPSARVPGQMDQFLAWFTNHSAILTGVRWR